MRPPLCITVIVLLSGSLRAETGYDAWLRYAPPPGPALQQYRALPAVVTTLGPSPVLLNARQELIRGLRSILGRTLRAESGMPKESAILLGDIDQIQDLIPGASLAPDGYLLKSVERDGLRYMVVTMRSKQWYTKTSRLPNSFVNDSIGCPPSFSS
jgi:alpha-glucuronidase